MSVAVNLSMRDAEMNFLENLRSQYEGKGYRFVVHPRAADLPSFFATYQPDAVATKPGHNIAIEVKSRATSTVQQSIQKIRKLFEGHPDWQFTVAYMGTDAFQLLGLPVADRASILEQAREAEQLAANGHLRAAFIFAWSLLEATLNSVRPDSDKRPRTPGTVVQTLAMNGHIAAETERSLRSMIDLRNRIVHGDVSTEPSAADVRLVLAAVNEALEESVA